MSSFSEKLVDAMIKSHSWDILDAQDEHANTALHVAARNGRHEYMRALAHLNPKIMNKDGDTPLHIAAEKGDEALMNTMLALFCNSEKGTCSASVPIGVV